VQFRAGQIVTHRIQQAGRGNSRVANEHDRLRAKGCRVLSRPVGFAAAEEHVSGHVELAVDRYTGATPVVAG